MRLLCISDIHGHANALERVLEVGNRHGCSQVLVAGDLCFPGPDPLRTWNLLMSCNARCVQGVADRALAVVDPASLRPSSDEERERALRFEQTREALGDIILARLKRLPTSFRLSLEDGGELLLVHGSPSDPTSALTPDMDDAEMAALLGDDPPSVVVCGASHSLFERTLGETRVLNVGSVGEPPTTGIAHAMIVLTTAAGIEVRPLYVPLDASAGDPTKTSTSDRV